MARVLITGASAGIGAELARLFAADGRDLILVARRRERLEELAAELAERGVRVDALACDLGAEGGAPRLVEEIDALGEDIDVLVNNAGVGTNGYFVELDPERELTMLRLNVLAPVELARTFAPRMVERGYGRILNVGSTAGFQPGPFMANYYASKAFLNNFSVALSHELRGTGVTATVSCPGATATEFADTAGVSEARLFKTGVASADAVARQAYRAMHAGKALIVHGLFNKLVVFLGRFSPRRVVRSIAAHLNKAPGTRALPEPRATPSGEGVDEASRPAAAASTGDGREDS